MGVIVTPGQLARRAEFYHQLSQLTSAGITLMQALQLQQRSPPDRSFRPPLTQMIKELEEGATFSQSLRKVRHWLPTFDLALLEAGEKSGRLPPSFRLLSEYYRERDQLARQVLSDLAYPAFLFHFAIFIGPFPAYFTSGDTGAYLRQTLGVLLPLYAVLFVFLYAAQNRHGEAWRSWLERFTRLIPIGGAAQRQLALSRLAAALEALLSAGVPIIEAWELAAASSGSPALLRAVRAWRPKLDAGLTPAEAVNQSREFPELFANMYHSGEISGQLDDSLKQLQALYREEGSRRLRALARWTPQIVYLAVVLMIAYRVISFYSNYFGRVGEALNF